MDEEELQTLISKFIDKTATPIEIERLMEWVRQRMNRVAQWRADNVDSKEQLETEMLEYILDQTAINSGSENTRKKRFYRKNPWIKYAAAILLLFALSTGIYFYINKKKELSNKQAIVINNKPIVPGSNGAILTLANGKQIILDSASIGSVSKQGNAELTKTNNSSLVYSATDVSSKAVSFNTLETPKGRQFSVQLPDGTKVWLNAASSITYPVSFKGLAKREITLTGEAYFEVYHNPSQPFIVKTDKQEVSVLGTHFDINSYSDEGATKTTLLEGSIKLKSIGGKDSCILKPGEQAVFGAQLKVSHVDTDDAVDWKDGYFVLDNEDLGTIMRKVARWYNVDITYRDEDAKKFMMAGIIPKDRSISSVLKILSSTGSVHFQLQGNIVSVSLL